MYLSHQALGHSINLLVFRSIGAFAFGIISDVFGRKWAFNLSCLITSVFGMLLVRYVLLPSREPTTDSSPPYQAASKENYGAVCGLYFLSCIGLGGNIPIDATIALEFLPQNRRALVSLLSMWQPVGVVVASAIAYGTAAKYRCDVTLPACSTVSGGAACCTSSSNMGWRYEVIVIGAMTLAVFVLRFFVFTFYESPKFLLSQGREQEAIDVLHKIAKYNRSTPPTLIVEDFREVDRAIGISAHEQATGVTIKDSVLGMFKKLGFLRGLFLNRLECFSFVLLALAYMVSVA
jgi:MFS family permease